MSTKEKIYSIIDSFSDEQLPQIYTMIVSVKNMLEDEVADDLFCQKLYEEYLNDTDPDKDEYISLEQAANELGIVLDDVQNYNK